MLKAGAADVVLRSNLGRLGPVAERETRAAGNRRTRRRAEAALAESEARKSAVLEASLDPIVTIGDDGRIVEFNEAAERTFGVARQDAIGREIVSLIIPADQQDRYRAGLAHYLSTGQGPMLNRRVELTACRADGGEVPVELTIVPVKLHDSTLFTAYIRDITDRRVLERDLQQAQRLESLGQLAGGIAHDFNNLLVVICNYAAFVAEEVDRAAAAPDGARWAAVREDVGAIIDAGERATALTRQLLAFARRDVARPRVVDLNEIVERIEGLLRRTIGSHIELVTRRGADLWPVRIDPSQVEQVLVNLAVNARDAMPGGGRLSIETANIEVGADHAGVRPGLDEGRFVRLRVSDTGSGMDETQLARAFEPFFTTKPRGEGTGLGLATVYGIVKQAGGDAQLYSDPGVGTTFTALLPATDDAATEQQSRQPATAGAGLGGDETVLVVDDESPIRELARRILGRNGYRVIVATDGADAIDIVRRRGAEIDLVVTDLVMPHLSGKEVAERVGTIRPGLPVLFMSGHAQPSLDATGVLGPGDVLLEKPFSESELLGQVRALLQARAGRRRWRLPGRRPRRRRRAEPE